jgi:hypothetical protein
MGYFMVKLPFTGPGDKRNTRMWNKWEGKTKEVGDYKTVTLNI